jgi:hypothetical protein
MCWFLKNVCYKILSQKGEKKVWGEGDSNPRPLMHVNY